MDHREVVNGNIVELYLRQELSHEKEVAFEEHLLFCEICRRDLDTLEKTIESIERLQMDTFRGKRSSERSFSSFSKVHKIHALRIAAIFVLLVSIVGIVALIFRREQTKQSTFTVTENIADSSGNQLYPNTARNNDTASGTTVKEHEYYKTQYAENFTTSPFYENVIENNLRSSEIVMISPVEDTLHQLPVFKWSDAKNRPLTLVVFSNKELRIYKNEIISGTKVDLAIKPGLYYWQLQDTGETLITSRFIYLPSNHQ
jgi:hypothetical protein